MKNLFFLSLLIVTMVSCNSKKSVDSCQVWPPNDSINVIKDSLIYDFDSQTMGMHGVNQYGELDNPWDENGVKEFNKKFEIVEDSLKINETYMTALAHQR